MLVIRELEEMIVKLRSGAYEPIREFNYRGPTHVSVGQEGTAAGACCALQLADNITSTHRGHGESLAKGTVAIRQMTDEQLRKRVPNCTSTKREDLIEAALEEHVYRTICELFGKDDGYCRGRGGSMHIADFTVGHLGANAIVGGGVPIATGAALANRYLQRGNVVCCFAGDGAYANGVVLESLNFAAQAQFTNHLADGRKFGLPIIFLVCNNHYGMTHRSDDEVMGVERMARRAGGFCGQQHARRDRQRHERARRARRRDARRQTLPRRQRPGVPGRGLLPLLGPFAQRPAQRIPHQGRGSRVEGDGCHRDATRRNCSTPRCLTPKASPRWRNAWSTATPAPPSAPSPPPIPTPRTC